MEGKRVGESGRRGKHSHGKELVGAACAIVWHLPLAAVLDSYLRRMANRREEPANCKDFSSVKYRANLEDHEPKTRTVERFKACEILACLQLLF